MTNEEAMETIGKNWNARQPTTPTTGEDAVERFIPQRARSGGGWYSYDQHRDDSVFWHGEKAIVQKDCDQRNAAISPTTEDAEKRKHD